jgi:hypothetical protein
VASKNLKRRHLSAGQKAAAAVEAIPFYAAEAKARMLAGKAPDPPARLQEGVVATGPSFADLYPKAGEAAEHAATQFDAKPRYVYEANRLSEQVPPVLFEAVRSGEVTIPEAKREHGVETQWGRWPAAWGSSSGTASGPAEGVP